LTANPKGTPRLRLRTAVTVAALVLAVSALAAWRLHAPGADRDDPARLVALRRATPPEMVLVPAGEFLAGSNDADADDESRPKHREYLPAFYIDVHEVTNREFHKFDPSHPIPPGEDDLPANFITYAEAAAYAKWAGKRLPTDAEWEKAARGTDGRRYPWGDTWDPKRVAQRRRRPGDPSTPHVLAAGKHCSIGPSRLQAVGSVPSGASPYGCLDMAGNAWEWVQGFYNGNPNQRVLRGGAIGYGERDCRTYVRSVEGDADT